MGRTFTPAYRLEALELYQPAPGHRFTARTVSQCWEGRKPTARQLAAYRQAYNQSLEPGGANQHLQAALGYAPRWGTLRAVHQKSGQVVATYTPPLFEQL